MVKRKRHKAYNCRLLERALNAEGKFRVLNIAHERCCRVRDEKIRSLEQTLDAQDKIIGLALKKAGGYIAFTREDIETEGGFVNTIATEEDGSFTIRRFNRKKLEEKKKKA